MRLTVAAGNPVPVTVITVPPCAAPAVGKTDEMVGGVFAAKTALAISVPVVVEPLV